MPYENFPTKISNKAIIVFVLASFFFFYDFVGQICPGVMAHYLMRDFSINATQLGIMASCFFWAYAAMQIPASILISKFGGKLIFTIVITICATSFLLLGLSQNVYLAAIARFMMGSSAAFSFVGTLYFIIRWFPPKYFALFVGITATIGAIGAIIVNEPLAIAIEHLGWRETMFIFSAFGFLLAFLVSYIVQNHPQKLKIKYKMEDKIFPKLKSIFRNAQTWFTGIYVFTIWGPVLAFAALWGIPFLMLKYDLSSINAAFAISFLWLGIAFGSPFLGWVSDFINRRCIVMSIAALISLFSIISIIFLPKAPISIIYFLLFLMGIGVSSGSIAFAIIKDNHPPSTNDIANGFTNTLMVISGVMFQPFIGNLLDFHWHGDIIDGMRVYDLHSYYNAFLILPISFSIALLMSMIFIKETYCKNAYDINKISTDMLCTNL